MVFFSPRGFGISSLLCLRRFFKKPAKMSALVSRFRGIFVRQNLTLLPSETQLHSTRPPVVAVIPLNNRILRLVDWAFVDGFGSPWSGATDANCARGAKSAKHNKLHASDASWFHSIQFIFRLSSSLGSSFSIGSCHSVHFSCSPTSSPFISSTFN